MLELFIQVFDHIGDEVIIVDERGKILFINQATAKAFGSRRAAVLGKSIVGFLKEKTSVQRWRKEVFLEAKNKKSPVSYTIERVVKGGDIQTVEIKAVHMVFKGREFIVSTGWNISKRVELQRHLNESEEMFRRLNEQAADGILTLDLKGRMLFINNALKKLVGIKNDTDFYLSHFRKFVAKESLKVTLEYFERVLKIKASLTEHTHIVDLKGNTIPVEFTATPIFKQGVFNQVHVIVRDIRKRRELERLMKESEKLNALQHLISGTSLEIRNPLKGVLDMTQNLHKRYADRYFEYIGFKEFEDIISTLGDMSEQLNYCYETINRLLSLERKKLGVSAVTSNAAEVIRSAVESIKHQMEMADIQLTYHLSKGLPAVAISPFELEQVLVNVMNN
ncbi:MAG: PAS domain S-box protein [Candidatus Omnitrophica bacterium]|nr:PAS domain S-box protein [Candidatus Omnitrophota bacterium]